MHQETVVDLMQHIDRFKGNRVTLKERIGQLSMAVANMYGSDRRAVMVRFESMYALAKVYKYALVARFFPQLQQ